MNNTNIILTADSYKYSQFCQYPPQTEGIYSYIESRGGLYEETVFFGLQIFLKEMLTKPVRMDDVDEAEELIKLHGLPFYRGGWDYIVKKHGGYLPVRIKAVPEGSVIPVKNVLVTIENTDPNCFWLTSFLETALLRAVWYPTTVCTSSFYSKKLILKYLIRNGDPGLIDFKLHDFGLRGVSSQESGGIGGLAHLVNFKGTDTVTALLYGRKYYNEQMAGFSIPAMEHSTVTSWGKDNELDAYRNMLSQYGKPGALLACVSDSYDIYQACESWGTDLKEQVLESGATVVVRPDCYSEDTSILTPKGWKKLSDLSEGDMVAQVEEDGSHTFVKPLRVYNEYYEGDMYHFRDHHGKMDLLVTPNHRIVFKRNGKWTTKIAEEITPTAWSYIFHRSAKAQDKGNTLSNEDRLRIAFQADGSYTSKGNKRIRFSFSKSRKLNRLTSLLDSMGLNYVIYDLKDTRKEISINYPHEEVSKSFDWVDTSNLCSRWCKEFIEELSHWDSSIRNPGRFKFDTTNPEVMEVVELIAISAGYGILISAFEDDRDEKFSRVYTAHILLNNVLGGQAVKKTKTHYSGRVVCVTVPTGRILVKRNRCTMVCGNSGNPPEVIPSCLQILDSHYGSTTNEKGYKVLNNVRMIQGDGIDHEMIDRILHVMEIRGYSSDNIAFGQGGGLLQNVNRDTQKFAMKCSAANVNGQWRDVFKDPITDPGKTSKKGRLQLLHTDGVFQTVPERPWNQDYLETVYENGQLLKEYALEDVRVNANHFLYNYYGG